MAENNKTYTLRSGSVKLLRLKHKRNMSMPSINTTLISEHQNNDDKLSEQTRDPEWSNSNVRVLSKRISLPRLAILNPEIVQDQQTYIYRSYDSRSTNQTLSSRDVFRHTRPKVEEPVATSQTARPGYNKKELNIANQVSSGIFTSRNSELRTLRGSEIDTIEEDPNLPEYTQDDEDKDKTFVWNIRDENHLKLDQIADSGGYLSKYKSKSDSTSENVKQKNKPFEEVKLKERYYSIFKNLGTSLIVPENPLGTYIQETVKRKALPNPVSKMYHHEGGQIPDYKLRHYRLGKARLTALAESLELNHKLTSIDLRSNGIDPKGALYLLTKVPTTIKAINLSDNKIGKEGTEKLCEIIKSYHYANLMKLNLESVNLGDKLAEPILKALLLNDTIKFLNLSKNDISDRSAPHISQLLQESGILQLYLHWNKITYSGCSIILDGLMKNDKLKVLDLSWNRIGDPKMVTVTKLAQYFEKTNTLAHLDLSHCGFSDDELDMISKALTKNHSILGIHLNGNGNFNFSTNSLGYLEKEKISDMSKQILWNRIPTSSKNANKKMIEYKGSGGCYICEGWREIKFVWKNTKPDFDPEPVYAHFSFDNWRADLMDREDENTWVTYKMCPPGSIQYYFSIKGEGTEINEEQASTLLPEDQRIHVFAKEKCLMQLETRNDKNSYQEGSLCR